MQSNGGKLYRWMVSPFSIDAALLLLRLVIGGLLIYHGSGKVFGDMAKFTGGVEEMGFPLPGFFAWAAALSEFLGGILIVLGLGMRVATAMGAVTMIVAAFVRHADDAFKVKELALAYLGVLVVLHWLGPGRYSLDHLLFGRTENARRLGSTDAPFMPMQERSRMAR